MQCASHLLLPQALEGLAPSDTFRRKAGRKLLRAHEPVGRRLRLVRQPFLLGDRSGALHLQSFNPVVNRLEFGLRRREAQGRERIDGDVYGEPWTGKRGVARAVLEGTQSDRRGISIDHPSMARAQRVFLWTAAFAGLSRYLSYSSPEGSTLEHS